MYLCECNGEISKKINLDQVESSLQNVDVKKLPMLCTPEVISFLSQDISGYERAVFAACTPKRIESTFRNVARKAGLNPYLIQTVNLREQCAWVSDNIEAATSKATSLINGALKRIEFNEPLEEKLIDLNTDVAIVGAGISGIFAALAISEDKNRNVYLIEKTPFIGGKTISYEELFPEFVCAQCLLSEALQEVLDKDNIILYTDSIPVSLKGNPGNFQLGIKKKPRYVDINKCIGCGECVSNCPVKIPNELEFGMDERNAIYFAYPGVLPNTPVIDSKSCLHEEGCKKCEEVCIFDAINFDEKEEVFEIPCGALILATGYSTYPDFNGENVFTSPKFERILSKEGPTGGKILLENGEEPDSIAIIHCAGRKELGYCSKICCSIALKYSHIIHRKIPGCKIHHIYSDMILPPFHWRLFEDAKKFTEFHRKEVDVEVEIICDEKITLKYGDQEDKTLKVDMAVLMCGIKPAEGLDSLVELFNLKLNKFGFVEPSSKLNPSEVSPGIFIAGGISSPVTVEEAVQQAYSSAGKILSILRSGEKLKVNPEVCSIVESRCSGCRFCIAVCPYAAISYNEDKGICEIEDAFCRGCGLCASACPSRAIIAKNYTERQIFAEIEGLIK